MDFEEWLEEYREDKNRSDADWYPNNVQVFEAGQQSKQAEIDALKNLIDEIVSIVREADLSDGGSSVAIVHDEIQELLK